MFKQRSSQLQSYCNIYDQIRDGLQKRTKEEIHGSLIVIAEMLHHTGDFMLPRFREICKAIMALKEHSSRTVRLAIIQLIPELAGFCPDTFARSHLNEAVDMMIKSSKNSDLRALALQSIGRLSLAIGGHLVYRVQELMAVVKEVLLQKRKEVPREVLVCISDMVIGTF